MNRPLPHSCHLCHGSFLIRDMVSGPTPIRVLRCPHCGVHWQETRVEVSERVKLTATSWVVVDEDGD